MAPRKTATKSAAKTAKTAKTAKKTSKRASAASKGSKSSTGTKSATATVTETPVPAPEPAVAPAPVASEAPASSDQRSLADEVSAFRSQLRAMTDALRTAVKALDEASKSGRRAVRSKEHNPAEFNAQSDALRTLLRSLVDSSRGHVQTLDSLDRRVRTEMRTGGRKTRRPRDPNAGPTAFQIPLEVTPEFRKFVNKHKLNDGHGLGPNERVSRVQAGRMLNAYINESGLKDAKDGRLWTPDADLRSLFHLDEGVTYSDTKSNRAKGRVGQAIDTSGTLERWHIPSFMTRHFVTSTSS